MGDLITMAFNYLLCSSEYKKTFRIKYNRRLVSAKRTRKFQVPDIRLWNNVKILPSHSTLEYILTSYSSTMDSSNQKSWHMGKILHHESTGPKGEVAALAHTVVHILSHSGTWKHLLCDYYKTKTWEPV